MARAEADKKNERLEQLYLLYREKLLHYAAKILDNPEDAEDTVQQTFCYLHENSGGLRDVRSRETAHYLSVITKHYALEMLRQRKRIAEKPVEDMQLDSGFQLQDPGPGRLDQALNALPEKERDLLLLRYADGLKTKEIAQMLGQKKETVKRALSRAKAHLKKKMEEGEDRL